MFSQSINSELKNDLWKTIKPEGKKDSTVIDSIKKLNVEFSNKQIPDISHFLNQYKSGLSFEDADYLQRKRFLVIDPHVYTFDISKLQEKDYNQVTTTSQFNGLIKNFSQGNGGFVIIVNISGGGQKKLSKKTKQVLIDVYNVPEEELKDK